MEVPCDAFATLVHSLRNSLASAVGECDLLSLEASRKGLILGSAATVRSSCLDAVVALDAWSKAHLTPFPFVVTPDFVEIVVPANPIPTAFEATIEHVLSHPGYRRGMGILYDRRRSEPPTQDYLDRIIAITRRYADRLGECRWAVVVRQSDTMTAERVQQVVRHLQPAAAIPGGSFTDHSRAVRWLASSNAKAS